MNQTISTSFNVAALQLETFSYSKLKTYWKICDHENIAFLLLGEYVLDPFFKAFSHDRENFIPFNIQELLVLSKEYQTALIASVVTQIDGKFYKNLVRIQQGNYEVYQAQRLIGFEHWNEKDFFANLIPKKINSSFMFDAYGLKIAMIFGFEVYFDEIWLKLKNCHVDVVFVSSVATFESHQRWRYILQSRAFLNSCYILRANRIGEYVPCNNEPSWKFYGDSLFISPYGEVESFLSENEELLIAQINPEIIMTHKKQWKFNYNLKGDRNEYKKS